jgi:hypothetical protein
MRICVLVLAMTFAMNAICRAEDEKAAPAKKTTRAATTARSAADVEQQQAALTSARTFVQDIIDDETVGEAYALMGADYQKNHSAEQFAGEVKSLRKSSGVARLPGMRGFVSLKPKNGPTPLAAFVTVPSRSSRFARGAGGPPVNPGIGVELAREDAGWRITGFRPVDLLQQLNVFGEDLRKNDATAESVTSALRGEVTAAEPGSFTVKMGDPGTPGEPRKFAVDEKTEVNVAAISGGRAARAGLSEIRTYRVHPGSADDIKAGQLATIEPSLDGKSAMSVVVTPKETPASQEEKKGL